MPIIFCALLAHTYLVVEQKNWKIRGEGETRNVVCEIAGLLASFKSGVMKEFRFHFLFVSFFGYCYVPACCPLLLDESKWRRGYI